MEAVLCDRAGPLLMSTGNPKSLIGTPETGHVWCVSIFELVSLSFQLNGDPLAWPSQQQQPGPMDICYPDRNVAFG